MDLIVDGEQGPQRVYAYTGGKPLDPSLPAVVFLHGALLDHSVWTLLARWCAHHGHAVLAPDLPGHARSEGPALTSIDALADWVLALLDAARIRDASLVGHSMGSLVALEVAARAPERVQRLVMLGTGFPMAVSGALLGTAAEAPLKAIDLDNIYSHSTLAAKPAYPGPGSWTYGSDRALMRRVQAGGGEQNLFLVDFELCNDYRGGFEAAAKVRCPVTFILGSRDQMMQPAGATELAKALNANVTTVRAGHAMMAEAPDEVLAALRNALA